MLSVFSGVLGVALVFGFAVFVHEFGHYLFARLRGVGVEAFAIGMGPKIIAWTRNGTEYSIRWLPIGGFVRLHQMIREDAEAEKVAEGQEAGQSPESVPQEKKAPASVGIGQSVHQDMEALYDKGFITKLLVFGGGVFFNYLTAIAATAVLFTIGLKRPVDIPANVWAVKSPEIASAGLAPGDRIIEVEGKPSPDLDHFQVALIGAMESGKAADGLDVKVERPNGQVADLKLPPLTNKTSDPYFSSDEGWASPWEWRAKPYVGMVLPYSPAAKAGFKEDDLIVKINGKEISNWSEMTEIVRSHADQAISMTVRRPKVENEIEFNLVPEEKPDEPGIGQIGVGQGNPEKELLKEPFTTALAKAPKRTTERLVMIGVGTFGRIYQLTKAGKFKSLKREVGGPLAIFNLTYKQAQKGIVDLLDWFIGLNLILAVMNLLPIPILDGGFILLSFIEAVVRRPVPAKVLTPVYTFFFFCFITLFVLISYQDIVNIFFRQ